MINYKKTNKVNNQIYFNMANQILNCNDIEDQRKKLIALQKEISIKTIQKLQLFITLIENYDIHSCNKNIYDLMFMINKAKRLVPCNKFKCIKYLKTSCFNGYIYLCQKTINIYSPDHNYIIKLTSIRNCKIIVDTIFLDLDSNNIFLIQFEKFEEDFFKEFNDKLNYNNINCQTAKDPIQDLSEPMQIKSQSSFLELQPNTQESKELNCNFNQEHKDIATPHVESTEESLKIKRKANQQKKNSKENRKLKVIPCNKNNITRNQNVIESTLTENKKEIVQNNFVDEHKDLQTNKTNIIKSDDFFGLQDDSSDKNKNIYSFLPTPSECSAVNTSNMQNGSIKIKCASNDKFSVLQTDLRFDRSPCSNGLSDCLKIDIATNCTPKKFLFDSNSEKSESSRKNKLRLLSKSILCKYKLYKKQLQKTVNKHHNKTVKKYHKLNNKLSHFWKRCNYVRCMLNMQ